MVAVAAAVIAASVAWQPQITVNDGHGWDGEFYFRMASEAGSGQRIDTDAPFVYRILVPLVAALVSPGHLVVGFKIVNVVAVVVTIVLMMVWLRRHLTSWLTRVTVMGLFLAQWTEPVRSFFWYPVLTDYWLVACLIAGLLVVERLNTGGPRRVWIPALCAISVVAVTVREAGLLIPLAALFTYNPVTGRLRAVGSRMRDLLAVPRTMALPLLAGGVTLVAIHLVVTADAGSYSFVRATGHWLLTTAPSTWALAWFIAYGPILAVPLFYWRACRQFLREHQYVTVFMITVAVLSWIGGNDIERFLTWGAPAVYVLVGIGLEQLTLDRAHVLMMSVLAVLQLVSARVLWALPDQVWTGQTAETVLLTPIGGHISLFDVTASDAAPAVRLVSELQYIGVLVVLLGVMFLLHRRRQPTCVNATLPHPTV